MNCQLSSLVGIGMLCATYATMSISEEQHHRMRLVFSDQLDEIYNKIISERRNQYFQGLLLGLFLSYFSLFFVKTINRFHRITFVLAITILTSVVYYLLMPKSDYMLNHLKTQEENKAWLDVYNSMKYRYLIGFLLGSAASIPIANSMC